MNPSIPSPLTPCFLFFCFFCFFANSLNDCILRSKVHANNILRIEGCDRHCLAGFSSLLSFISAAATLHPQEALPAADKCISGTAQEKLLAEVFVLCGSWCGRWLRYPPIHCHALIRFPECVVVRHFILHLSCSANLKLRKEPSSAKPTLHCTSVF